MPVDVLCLSHLRWAAEQRPNHLMRRWARAHRVFFVEEPRFDAAEKPYIEMREKEPRVFVVTPHLAPDTLPSRIDDALAELMSALVQQYDVENPILWFYTPMAVGSVRHLSHAAVVYDCMDDAGALDRSPPERIERERTLFDEADIVFAAGHSLYEAKRNMHPNVRLFPNSVDAAHFSRARDRPGAPEPDEQRGIAHPRVGFFGVVDELLDLDLVRDVADALPQTQFLMIGPIVHIHPAGVPVRPNLHYLKAKTYAEIPGALSSWNAAIMPFAMNDATRLMSATNILEYLAAGKPVISTPVPDVVKSYGELGLVRIARTAAEFAMAIEDAVAEATIGTGRTRRAMGDALVAQTSWDETWALMHALVIRLTRSGTPRVIKSEPDAPCSTL